MSKVWLVTGSSRGLGLALAKAVLGAGDQLVATARKPDDLRELVERHGDRVLPVALDVTSPAAARDAIAAATSAFGRRLLLGSDASYLAELVAEQRAAEDAKWRSLSVSTDFEGLGDFRETPVAKMLAAMVRGS
jgi:NAD(P)-dependent dehydrogenase (short-subunit alcohol dehydrogenase family)